MRNLITWLMLTFSCCSCLAQNLDAALDRLTQMPTKWLDRADAYYADLNQKLNRQSEKYLRKLQAAEEKMQARLAKLQPKKATALFQSSQGDYQNLLGKLQNPPLGNAASMAGEYLPGYDSLRTSLNFLSQHTDQLASKAKDRLTAAQGQMDQFQSRLQVSDQIHNYIQDRQRQLQEQFDGLKDAPKGLLRSFDGYKKQVYYYQAQVHDYRQMLREQPEKLIQKGMAMLAKLPAYQTFMKQYSQLAGLFTMPDNAAVSLGGMQTRQAVQALIQNQVATAGAGGMQALQANLQAAQAQLGQIKNKLNSLGKGSGELDMPNFKPNNQKTKPFWSRLEYGANMQSSKSNAFFPQQTDLAFTLGYKLNEKNVIGLGLSYQIGWGRDLKHISLTNQGVGLRSFIDIAVKGSFFASGGFEYNYAKPFASISQLHLVEQWQRSALAGVTKIISLKGAKWLKKSKVQLLYDFLYHQQIPQPSSPFKFRMGYSF